MTKAVHINKAAALKKLDKLCASQNIDELRNQIAAFGESFLKNGKRASTRPEDADEIVALSEEYLKGELKQIEETHTLERALYYIRRLKKALEKVKTSPLNDLNLNRWKEYPDVITDSLWMLDKRDSSGLHRAWYWGNFIPQIPHQLMMRYTKKEEWVIDTFAGSGTTLLEAQRLGRNCLGIELQPSVAKKARALVAKGAHTPRNPALSVLEVGDSATFNFLSALKKNGANSAQLVLMHPPYHDIIRFSKRRNDLSNACSPEAFAESFGRIVDNVVPVLDKGRFLAVVIGDKYEKGEWVPLGFMLMNEVLKRRFSLKSIVIKNFEETLGKRNQKELWRYRALAGGFYVFKHEYILIFRKR